jgi:hypothetical protein
MWQTPNCASQMTAAAAAAAAAAATAVATDATASPTRYERTLRNCARALSDFAGCTEPGAFWDEERFREWARDHRAEATKHVNQHVTIRPAATPRRAEACLPAICLPVCLPSKGDESGEEQARLELTPT